MRFPRGRGAKPLYSYWNGKKMSYIEARHQIYAPLYSNAVEKTIAYLFHLYYGFLLLLLFDYLLYYYYAYHSYLLFFISLYFLLLLEDMANWQSCSKRMKASYVFLILMDMTTRVWDSHWNKYYITPI